MARHKNANWNFPGPNPDNWEQAGIAVLMDIRDELQSIRSRLDCGETLGTPRALRKISANTARPRKKKDHGNIIARLDAWKDTPDA